MKYLIGVDIGTQGTKAALYDENMTLVGTAFQESNLIMSDTGGIWQEADEIYRSVILSIRQLVLESGVSGSCIKRGCMSALHPIWDAGYVISVCPATRIYVMTIRPLALIWTEDLRSICGFRQKRQHREI